MSKKKLLQGTLILTCSGLITRLIGFFYRIFLSHSIGAQGMGLYQLVVPVQTLIMAVTTGGIQTAISRLSASSIALGEEKRARDYFSLGTILAFVLSSLAALALFFHSDAFALHILKEPRTSGMIRLLSLSFPLSTLHICINGYYFAMKKTGVPSGIQLLEQAARVGVTYLLYLIFLAEGREITPIIAVGGALASEGAAVLGAFLFLAAHFHNVRYSPMQIRHPAQGFLDIFRLSLPLTLNRVLLTLLHSIEVVLIPQRLMLHGLNQADALSVYGIFTGMALPLVLFPSTITNSVSVMLLPSVAELQALGKKRQIRRAASRISFCCLALGFGCGIFFFLFGHPLGIILFKSPTAGTYIRTMAFICPFLYLNSTLASTLHGLGETGICLLHNVISVCIRISFVLLAIPAMGIRGYLYGILLGELTLTLLHTAALFRQDRDKS